MGDMVFLLYKTKLICPNVTCNSYISITIVNTFTKYLIIINIINMLKV